MNELLFLGTAFLAMVSILLCARLGREWLYAAVPLLLVLASFTAANVCLVFGFPTSLGICLYAAIFLATDILSECYGRKEGFRAVAIGFLTQAFMVLFGLMVVSIQPMQNNALSQALETIFSYVPRIAAGSFVAYLISQTFDVWFFHKMKDAMSGRHLWARNTVSTIVSQGIDSVIFLSIAFYGVLPNFWGVVLTTWVIKVSLAVIDTPFIYLARRFLVVR